MKDIKNRINMNINREWKFIHGDIEGAKEVSYDDSAWYDIGIPHSFSIPYFAEKEFYVGYGWYRKHLEVLPQWEGKKIFLQFEAAFQHAEVFVNGNFVGEHKGGYTGFYFDITKYVNLGDNLVAVRLNNLWDAEIAPRAGEHVFSGGIYRDVTLVVTEPLHVAWYGTFVTTPNISKEAANVNIKTEVINECDKVSHCLIKTTILDMEDNFVLDMEAEEDIAPNSIHIFDQTSEEIKNPKLWHPDHPYLYKAKTVVYKDNIVVDEYETTFGLRWFEFTKDKGFFLNGEHYYIKGANVHQDHAGWGDAVTQAGIYRDIKMIKDCGMNFIRGSHYPHHPYFAKQCDSLGILFWSELCYWGIGGFKQDGYWDCSAYPTDSSNWKGFEDSCVVTLKEMIRTNRNHPSIITWSMGNEIFFTAKEVMEKARDLVRKLVQISHEEDPTRPASVGGTQRGEFDKLGDVAGYNGDGAVLFINPEVPSIVAEYGSVISYRPGEYEGNFGECQNIEYPWRSGQSLWCAFHHGSIAGEMGKMGMIDYYRLPLKAYYWYRNEYLNIEPPIWPSAGVPFKLDLTADKMKIKNDGTDDSHIIVTVLDKNNKHISNSPKVTLSIVEGPGCFPTGSKITFSEEDKSMLEGMAAIEFRSYYAGITKIKAEAEGLEEAYIYIETVGEEKWQNQSLNPILPPPAIKEKIEVDLTIDVARNRPTFTSSDHKDHPRNYGNDGLSNTRWSAEVEGNGQWWKVDLENFYKIYKVKIVFEKAISYLFKIEISVDGKQWVLAVDEYKPEDDQERDFSISGVYGRYIRIIYTGLPEGEKASHYSFEVYGIVS